MFTPWNASITDFADFTVSPSTTPIPCVPSTSLMTTGAPPTRSMMSSACLGSWVKAVTGSPIPRRAKQLEAAKLVARAADGHRFIQRVDAHDLELA